MRRGFRRRRGAGAACRLRLRRNPRRTWLSDLAIPDAVREPPRRRIWRLARKPRALRPRGAARGENGGARYRRDLPPLGRGLFPPRHAVVGGPAGCDLGGGGGGRRASYRGRSLSLAALGGAADPADGIS